MKRGDLPRCVVFSLLLVRYASDRVEVIVLSKLPSKDFQKGWKI